MVFVSLTICDYVSAMFMQFRFQLPDGALKIVCFSTAKSAELKRQLRFGLDRILKFLLSFFVFFYSLLISSSFFFLEEWFHAFLGRLLLPSENRHSKEKPAHCFFFLLLFLFHISSFIPFFFPSFFSFILSRPISFPGVVVLSSLNRRNKSFVS